ncbi:MAG: AI-2E family transporter [Pontiellaceae bacterium]|jgi:predicted PurR-regulated permease PerM|nr:AI-2E family transporter [Pontiellaceae bacterium]
MEQNQRILIPLIGIIALILVGFVLKTAQSVILPLVIAWFLSYLFAPLVNFLARKGVPSGPSVGVVLIVLLGFFYLTGLFLYARVMAFVAEYPKYEKKFTEIAAALDERYTIPSWISPNTVDWQEKAGEFIMSIPGSFVEFAGKLILVLIFLVFILLGKPYLDNKLRHAFPDDRSEKLNRVTSAVAYQITRYLYIKLLISAATGFLAWLVLRLIGVDFPVTWGVLTFLFNFIPTIGSIVATIPPVLLAFIQFYPDGWTALIVLAALTVIQQVMGNFIDPKVTGDNLNLSPVVILISLVFWGWLWGITGALLSVPIASAIKIVCENIEVLKPVSILMGSGKKLPDTV